jgi:hypothetical protein
MTINDGWLKELARKRREAAQSNGRVLLKGAPPIDGLWASLQEETRRQARVYTDELGDPNAIVIETSADAIEGRTSDGRHLVLRLDREGRRLSETFRNQAGAVRRRTPIIKFTTNAAGEAAFNFGGVPGAAGSIIRRLV